MVNAVKFQWNSSVVTHAVTVMNVQVSAIKFSPGKVKNRRQPYCKVTILQEGEGDGGEGVGVQMPASRSFP